MTTEERIARLEELAYFQETLLSQLNDALTGQQKQLDALEKRLEDLESNVTALLANDAMPEPKARPARPAEDPEDSETEVSPDEQ